MPCAQLEREHGRTVEIGIGESPQRDHTNVAGRADGKIPATAETKASRGQRPPSLPRWAVVQRYRSLGRLGSRGGHADRPRHGHLATLELQRGAVETAVGSLRVGRIGSVRRRPGRIQAIVAIPSRVQATPRNEKRSSYWPGRRDCSPRKPVVPLADPRRLLSWRSSHQRRRPRRCWMGRITDARRCGRRSSARSPKQPPASRPPDCCSRRKFSLVRRRIARNGGICGCVGGGVPWLLRADAELL